MARNGNTFEKRRREVEKRRKAEEKRARRRMRREQPAEGETTEGAPLGETEAQEPTQTQDETQTPE